MKQQHKKELNSLLFGSELGDIRFGCVLFDLQENTTTGKMSPWPGTGWASIEGKPATRIRSTADLSSDVKWWTNLTQDILWKSGAVKHTKLKHSGYLRTDLVQIAKELDLMQQKMTTGKVCEALSEIFNKVMRISIEFLGIKSLNESELTIEFKNLLLESDKNISSYVDEALVRSYQDLVLCEDEIDKNKKFISLKRPRYLHAKSLLEMTIPIENGDWEFLGSEELPLNADDKVNFFIDMKRPFVAKISIIGFKDSDSGVDFSRLLKLGEAIGEKGKKKERNWVSQPEFLFLNNFLYLDVEAAFLASGYKKLELKHSLPDLGDLSIFSYSLGLLAENYWIAVSNRSFNAITKSKTLVSPRASWVRAADRFFCFTSAMILESYGINVHSYGFGSVNISYTDDQIPLLIKIAPEANLIMPLSLLSNATSIFPQK